MANGSAVTIARVQAGRNAAIVESAYEALNTGDIDALQARCFKRTLRGTRRVSARLLEAVGGAKRSVLSSAVMAERLAGPSGRTC